MKKHKKIESPRERQINYFKLYLSTFEQTSREYDIINEKISRLERSK